MPAEGRTSRAAAAQTGSRTTREILTGQAGGSSADEHLAADFSRPDRLRSCLFPKTPLLRAVGQRILDRTEVPPEILAALEGKIDYFARMFAENEPDEGG